MMDFKDLKRRIEQRKEARSKTYEARKAKLREHYRYARDKGFSSEEAGALSFESKETIDRLAAERAEKS